MIRVNPVNPVNRRSSLGKDGTRIFWIIRIDAEREMIRVRPVDPVNRRPSLGRWNADLLDRADCRG